MCVSKRFHKQELVKQELVEYKECELTCKVSVVMERHRLVVDRRLERIVGVRQWG